MRRALQTLKNTVCNLDGIEVTKNLLFDFWRDKFQIRRKVNLRLAVATGFHFAERDVADVNDFDAGCIRKMSWP